MFARSAPLARLGIVSLTSLWLTAAGCDTLSEAKKRPPAAEKSAPAVAAPAKPAEPAKPTESAKPAEPARPAEAAKPAAGDPALAGVDPSVLDPSQRKGFDLLLDQKPSPCGKGHSLRTSLKSDPTCRRALFAGRYLVMLLKAGLLPSEAEEHYDKRFVSPAMARCDVTSAPLRGNPRAPVTVCEFSDFQCPHCKLVAPMLQRLLDEYRDQLRLAFKNFPLSKLHPDAADAAAAAIAAGKQGRFWQFHDKLFANQERMTPLDLERYAGELKLDVKKWKADQPAARAEVDKDRAEGDKLELDGTPSLYINDRKYSGPLRYESIKDWIDEELAR